MEADAMANGISTEALIARAAAGIFAAREWKPPVLILCGSGNNASDGYALALLLQKANLECAILRLTDRATPEGERLLSACRDCGVPIFSYHNGFSFSPYEELVDCMLGIGFCGELRAPFDEVIARVNASGKYIVSIDINSGLSADGGIGERALRSDLTLSLGERKIGLYLADGRDLVGKVLRVDIGLARAPFCRALAEESDFSSLVPPRRQNCHKGDFGYVSILGGCTRYTGAVKLANLAASALCAGCGVSQVILPASLAPSVSPYLLESTLYPLPDRDGYALFDEKELRAALQRQRALAVGMGWGTSAENEKILSWILENLDLPLVIDADGLNTLARMDRAALKAYRGQVILTPHPREMERISGVPLVKILANPAKIAEEYAKATGAVVLLKGASTVVTDGEETLLVARGGAGMATAGSGDVLSGILAGLLGYLPPTVKTVACGAYLAGMAGELAEDDLGEIAMTSSDTVAKIKLAAHSLFSSKC